MSDTSRRQPPSPLVFSPENVLSPAASQNAAPPAQNNTVSMPFVRRHVTRRLKAAKAECDKELQRVTNNITAFFEERLRENDQEQEREYRERERERDLLGSDPDTLSHPYAFHPNDLRSALQTEESGSDGGYDAELEPATLHSRYPSSSMGSPASARRTQPVPWDKPMAASLSASTTLSSSPAGSTVMLPDAPITRRQTTTTNTGWSSGNAPSRRLSRSIHIASRPVQSGHSSRSTSRSRSPLPPLHSHGSFTTEYTPSTSSSNRRSSRYLLDDPIDPIMGALYEIIGVSTDIIDMTINHLTAQPKTCESLVQRVQNIGKTWDEHPDWQGRSWYVQVLLAVASLSRVVEWWEAEKNFWNFEDNGQEFEEPLTFVMKPPDESAPPLVPTPTTASRRRDEVELENFRLDPEDDVHLKMSRTTSHQRKSRQEASKDSMLNHMTSRPHAKQDENSESARVLATERLRLQAETAQNQNIVLELSLDGEHFLWVNYAWTVVVGTEAEELPGTQMSLYLHPTESDVFHSATERLLQNDAMTLEARFKLRIEADDDREVPPGHTLYRQMEGKGMLMIDREDGQPSHTMWVIKPITTAQWEADTLPAISLDPTEDLDLGDEEHGDETTDSALPFDEPISTEPILCRICECQIPQWYFEKHSETCAETHRLEAEISECNESIGELRNTIRDLSTAMDRSSPAASIPEYRGMPIYSPSSSPSGSPSQLHHFFRTNKMQKFGVKKMQRQLLDSLDDILQVALEVSVPSLKDDEAKEPIERQRLLSPGSERKMSTVRTWPKPHIEDPALFQLLNDAERIMRQKIDNVVRMQNTIRYAEKVWQEWEEKVSQYLDTLEDGEDSQEDSSDATDQEASEPSRSRTPSESPSQQIMEEDYYTNTSEYAYSGQAQTSSDYTPMPSTSPMSFATPLDLRPQSVAGMSSASRQAQYTRSSTPSSVSSPLAIAAPIVAPPAEHTIPPMSLDDRPAHVDRPHSNSPLKGRKSTGSLLDTRSPGSPQSSDKDSRERPSRRAHRNSTANILTSPIALANAGLLSPRQSSVAPLSRTQPTSIKDFEIIKPISKGAFGSVFLAKKKVTGDYYAIKVLKKADMIAKNQITNVKAERMILMKQAESPFVAKLYFTFQSKENLYLVMEYLNGGDCAALIKSLGCLPEEWTKNYIAEVVLGLEYLHQRGVVHRDLKPDNLLIDQHGHLKLTDFGLSRIGLLGRQTREGQMTRPHTRYNSRSRPPSMDSAYLSSPLLHPDANGSYFAQRTQSNSRPGSGPYLFSTDDASESGQTESVMGLYGRRHGKSDSPLQSFATELTTDLRSHSHSHSTSQSNSVSGTPPAEQKFVGTPDYLAPETILGLRGDDAAVDWWALGVITYEFLYGIPPFHAETPEKVFENILSGHIEWHEDWIDFSLEARDFMERLLTVDPHRRLGANGAEEIKAHPFFRGIDWDKVTATEAAFIPQVTDPESTDYFDPRGAIPQLFHDDDQIVADNSALSSPVFDSSMPPPPVPPTALQRESSGTPGDENFGSFSFKNLPVLKQANDDVIRKLKTDQMVPLTHAMSETGSMHGRRKSISRKFKKPPSVVTTIDRDGKIIPTNPPSPATSTSSIASSPSRASVGPSAPGSAVPGHSRKPSELGTVERFRLNHMEGLDRRNTMPSRLRTASVSSGGGDNSGSETWNSSIGHGSANTPPSSVHSIDLRKGPDPTDRAVICLLAEDNPITAKIIETLLIRLGCRVVVVNDGSEAISVAMGDIKFDCILMDLHMPFLDGEGAAKYIRSTNSKNTNVPIIAVSAYSGSDPSELPSNLFSGSLAKPLQKADLVALMRQLGFKTSTTSNGPGAKITAAKIVS